MESSICPFCHLSLPSAELQWHSNSHFEDEDKEAKYLELANQIQIASSSGSTNVDSISSLIGLQTRGNYYHVKDGLISLLRNCLELEARHNSSITILSGYVDHFHSVPSIDVGWGCGWRNIQMLCSHLLAHRQEAREVLFGGSGFVPDIAFLQRWLEIAWERGFDPPGAQHFNCKIYGTSHWIGTTECASLFRSFGLRARVVDFGPKESEQLFLSVPGSTLGQPVTQRNAVQVSGPMDRYVHRQQDLNKGKHSCDSLGKLSDNSQGKSEGPQVLIDWVWNYFSDKGLTVSSSSQVVVSDRAPLYFQHDGHSRTIIGIQVKNQQNGMRQFNLLILDPAERTFSLERTLKINAGWQKLIKRGVHTIKKPQYQLCYIDPGIASGEELEELKTINSMFFEL
ncbi:SUMO-conjugating enzyme SCE1-like [Hibiscus syriacus]|uniref:SUMO-conjugating enzyme SCE1-like n=1 Tax=Hibiscus syriacus TaxID=106335 RepID=A0A6A3B3D1_HIBSY|nr:zinc finger-containing ubiquitin peptidase 1 [Hibiscus syriacus]XP_038993539.1 zinc finger-containing ubiquitin peptidase 1 [Hibiscus syriacus]XP_038993540.1 zinc finger-containing ubiquitin peptidase 1 [Hibiscus syriacus]KAE8710723.1 SUMO-conjugating enzyme SCE1-like [Hibiscus syriacus]